MIFAILRNRQKMSISSIDTDLAKLKLLSFQLMMERYKKMLNLSTILDQSIINHHPKIFIFISEDTLVPVEGADSSPIAHQFANMTSIFPRNEDKCNLF
jgi:hypothetical protein